jgi:hypothetical protein
LKKEVVTYTGYSFPDFESTESNVANRGKTKTIISRMPLLLPDLNVANPEEPVTYENMHKPMDGIDQFKFRKGGTCYVDGVIFSHQHPKTDALVIKHTDFPLNLKLKLLDGSNEFTYVKVRTADRRKTSVFKSFGAASHQFKSITPNSRHKHKSANSEHYMIAFGMKNGKQMESNKKLLFKLNMIEYGISKLAADIEDAMEKDFSTTLQNIRDMESVSNEESCVGKYAKSMDVSKDLGNEPHFDVNDAGPGISIWLMDNPKKENEDWYFILQNCSVNGSQGVAIKLHHGIMIE